MPYKKHHNNLSKTTVNILKAIEIKIKCRQRKVLLLKRPRTKL